VLIGSVPENDMTNRGLLVAACLYPTALALAHPLDFSPLPPPRENDTVAAARLSPRDVQQILAEVEKTSYDVPDSWQTELRMRRVSLGGNEALIVRGTEMLCGATGNCETWLFRRAKGRWVNLFVGEAPVVATVGVARHESHGLPDLVATAHLSANTGSYVVYAFDGRVYRQAGCYEVLDHATQAPRKTACGQTR
jgi:hypothetical protein